MKMGLFKKTAFIVFLLIVSTLLFAFILPISLQASTKRIEIDLSNQRLYAYEDNNLIYNFFISSGKLWWPTPTGIFYPWTKLRFDRMIGGSRYYGTYYDLPNVPYVVYFYKGYAIHGTYWHSNFGVPMSHGCINLSIPAAEKIYNWINYSTPINIYGRTPSI